MKELKQRWTGLGPLLMSNGEMVDPLHPTAIAAKEITRLGAKKMTATHYQQLYRLKWEGALYWDQKVGPFIPKDNIEACIIDGARKLRLGKQAESAVWVSEEIVKLNYKGPRDIDGLYADRAFVFKKRTKLGTISVRPRIPGWSLEFTAEFDDTILDEKDLKQAIKESAAVVGLGDWRPKYGRFEVKFL